MLKRALHLFVMCLVCLLVLGCDSTDTTDNPPVPVTNPTPFPGYTFPLVDPANSVIPLPNDLLRNPTTGKLAFPGTGEPFDAANSLNGFSTSGAVIIPFRGTVVASSVTNDTIQVFNTTTGQQAPFTWSVSNNNTGSVVTGAPVRALDEETTYVVVITQGVISALSNTPILSDNVINILKSTSSLVDGNGNSTNSALSNAQAAALEPVRQAFNQFFAAAETVTGQSRANIPLAFAFTTQSLFDTLPPIRTQVVNSNRAATNLNPAFVGGNMAAEFLPVAIGNDSVHGDARVSTLPFVDEFFASLPAPANAAPNSNIARVHIGAVTAPVFRSDRKNGFWSEPPVQTGTQTVPFYLFLPRTVPGGGASNAQLFNGTNSPVPVVIFQHGITRSKDDAVVLANAVCGTGQALIAIDLELHGDLKASGDANGDGFINLPNLRNSRDNIRQSVVNLYALNQAIVSGQTNLDNLGGPELGAPVVNAAFPNPSFIGTSLGAIVGDVFHATEANVARSVLNVGGARITNLLLNSQTFAQPVLDGLASQGVVQGTSQFAQFFLIAQAVVDDADPVNYADQAITGTLRGGSSAQILQQLGVTDAVVPPSAQYDMAIQHANGTATPAFSQVDAVVAQALIPQATAPFQGPGVYEMTNSAHGAILDPSQGPTTAIVTQALTYLGTGNITSQAALRTREISPRVVNTSEYVRAIRF